MLYAHRVPTNGGETEFADLRAAWEALPDKTKAELEGLIAMHDIAYSRSQIGFTELLFGEREVLPPVPQHLVRIHPGSRRKTLYLASHASHVVGLPIPEGRLLLRDLIEFATQPQFVYRHVWREGDLVIWDNRCTMHRGRPFDERETRDLRRVTTRDLASTLDQVA
jgi:alpha-ketoglutarate-dependent 2,4-dichlorophenoxyacetate dioxygenase